MKECNDCGPVEGAVSEAGWCGPCSIARILNRETPLERVRARAAREAATNALTERRRLMTGGQSQLSIHYSSSEDDG